jgi:RNA polymerase sigma-70 factor (ECF subfamily)
MDRDAAPVTQPYDAVSAIQFADDDRAHLDHLLAARKDPARFEPLYRRYVSDVFYYCFRRLDHREDAADAASRTFANAIARLDAFRPDPVSPAATFRAWLFRIAHNVVVDMQRRQRPQRALDEEVFRMPHASRTP